MIWAYVLNLKTWFMGDFFQNYGKNFPNIWAATAYKGNIQLITIIFSTS